LYANKYILLSTFLHEIAKRLFFVSKCGKVILCRAAGHLLQNNTFFWLSFISINCFIRVVLGCFASCFMLYLLRLKFYCFCVVFIKNYRRRNGLQAQVIFVVFALKQNILQLQTVIFTRRVYGLC